jgi:hypothetical protein
LLLRSVTPAVTAATFRQGILRTFRKRSPAGRFSLLLSPRADVHARRAHNHKIIFSSKRNKYGKTSARPKYRSVAVLKTAGMKSLRRVVVLLSAWTDWSLAKFSVQWCETLNFSAAGKAFMTGFAWISRRVALDCKGYHVVISGDCIVKVSLKKLRCKSKLVKIFQTGFVHAWT